MFLLPLLAAGACDAVVLYVKFFPGADSSGAGGNDFFLDDFQGSPLLYRTGYLVVLCMIRLVVLLPMMIYYSASGRRNKYALSCHTFHVLCAACIVIHVLCIAVAVETPSIWQSRKTPQSLGSRLDGEGIVALRRVSAMLLFSLISIAMHSAVMRHLRTTAPRSAMAPGSEEMQRKKRRRLAYAYRKLDLRGGGSIKPRFHARRIPACKVTTSDSRSANLTKSDLESGYGFFPKGNEEEIDAGAREWIHSATETQVGSPDQTLDSDMRKGRSSRSRQKNAKVNGVGKVTGSADISSSVNMAEFLIEVQARIEDARVHWAKKLEEVTCRIQSQVQQMPPSNESTFPPVAVTSAHADAGLSNNRSVQGLWGRRFAPLSPFPLLLQLFAYEEVLDNGKLDACFDADNGENLTFYVPQLLSFLLHGAFLNSESLEQFLLDKCSRNLHFAHRCYWFLRAWCLCDRDHGHERCRSRSVSSGNLIHYGSERNLYLLPRECLLETKSIHSSSNGRQTENEEKKADDQGIDSQSAEGNNFSELFERRGSKLDFDEHEMIEELTHRLIEHGAMHAQRVHDGMGHGEQPVEALKRWGGKTDARQLSFGNTSDLEEETEPLVEYKGDSRFSELSFIDSCNANDSSIIPMDPLTGNPSDLHLASATASKRKGILPYMEKDRFTPKDLFLAAPRFLDALTLIADDLLPVPREQRNIELRKRLRSLEVELLPSNVVYVPIGCVYHRVWRIVVDESIALSTKERVPCIVTMEVVDYNLGLERATTRPSNIIERMRRGMTEREQISEWRSKQRLPQRHNSFLGIISSYTNHGLKKIKDIKVELSFTEEERCSSMERSSSSCDEDEHGSESSSEEFHDAVSTFSEAESKTNLSEEAMSPLLTTVNGASHVSASESNASTVVQPVLRKVSGKMLSSDAEMGQWGTPSRSQEENNGRLTASSGLHGSPTIVKGTALPAIPRQIGEIRDISTDGQRSPSLLEGSVGRQHHLSPNREKVADAGASSSPSDEGTGVYGATHSTASVTTALSPLFDRSFGSANRRYASERSVKPPFVVFKEDWSAKEERLRRWSVYGRHPGWRLLPVLIKSNDDLRQEQLASQLIQRMAAILARAKVPVWLCPYEIIALTDRGGIIEAIPDTISLDSLKRNDPSFTSLKAFFLDHFGAASGDSHADAKANFVESIAAYSMICFLLQIKDRHNGNILLDNKGHLIHIDFGFFFLSSPGKNSGFESAPFKLTRDFVNLMDGPNSRTFAKFRDLCIRTFLELRKRCYEIILLVEMIMEGNEDLPCFRGQPELAVKGLRERFRLDLNDNACVDYVNALINESLENWRTQWYDRYQRLCVGVL